jgi:hypothetical protein
LRLDRIGFSTTRNAVLGKADRMGLASRPRSGGRPSRPPEERAARRRLRQATWKPLILKPRPVVVDRPPVCAPKDIWTIGYGECRFIVNDGGRHALYCAAPCGEGSWCPYHLGIVYRRGADTPAPRPWHPGGRG